MSSVKPLNNTKVTLLPKTENEKCSTKRALTCLVIGIISAFTAALLAYCLTNGMIDLTALAGGIVGVNAAFISYAIMLCRAKNLIHPEWERKDYWNNKIISDMRPYPGDLTAEEKPKADATPPQIGEDEEGKVIYMKFLHVQFPGAADFNISIRCQNMFDSGAKVLVNAANDHLRGGAGIDGHVHYYGGISYTNEHSIGLRLQYPNYASPTKAAYISGHAALLKSGNLKKDKKVDRIIVVAGPLDNTIPKQSESELYSCYYNSLVLAHNHGYKSFFFGREQGYESIAFPAISTGIFSFPLHRAAEISLRAIKDFITNHPNTCLKTISIHDLPLKRVDASSTLFASYEKALSPPPNKA